MNAAPIPDSGGSEIALTDDERPATLVPFDRGRPASPVDAYLLSLTSEDSRRACRDSLRRILRVIKQDADNWRETPWHLMEPAHAMVIKSRLERQFGPSTVKLALNILRGVLREAWRLGLVDTERRSRIVDWGRVRGQVPPVGRMLAPEEVSALRNACEREGTFLGALDAAILAVGFGAGLRRDSISRLDADALSDDGRKLLVHAKGGKTFVQPLPAWAGGAVETWLAQRARVPLTTPAMFPHVKPNGRVLDKRLNRAGVSARLASLGKTAGIVFTPHDMRRTYASNLFSKVDITVVRDLMHHSNIAMTARYDRRGDGVKEDAVNTLEGWGAETKKG